MFDVFLSFFLVLGMECDERERNDMNVRVSKGGNQRQSPGVEEKHAMLIFVSFLST
jgi:hypothetical protein